jgi:hypothetical protein
LVGESEIPQREKPLPPLQITRLVRSYRREQKPLGKVPFFGLLIVLVTGQQQLGTCANNHLSVTVSLCIYQQTNNKKKLKQNL